MSFDPLLVSAVGDAEGSLAAAAALACAVADTDRGALLADIGIAAGLRPTVIASSPARELEERLATELPQSRAAARGLICHVTLPEPAGLSDFRALAGELPCVVHAPPALYHASIAALPSARAVLLRADLAADRSLAALAVDDLRSRGLRVRILKRSLDWIAARRALLGALPASARGGLPPRLLAGLDF